jgi:hypothetical protein
MSVIVFSGFDVRGVAGADAAAAAYGKTVGPHEDRGGGEGEVGSRLALSDACMW